MQQILEAAGEGGAHWIEFAPLRWQQTFDEEKLYKAMGIMARSYGFPLQGLSGDGRHPERYRIAPGWVHEDRLRNGAVGGSRSHWEADEQGPALASPSAETMFPLTLHPTYFHHGFFNVSVEFDRLVRGSEGNVPLLIGPERRRVLARVDRSANTNGTARVLGGTELRDWFQRNCRVGQTVYVDLSSMAQIGITINLPEERAN